MHGTMNVKKMYFVLFALCFCIVSFMYIYHYLFYLYY